MSGVTVQIDEDYGANRHSLNMGFFFLLGYCSRDAGEDMSIRPVIYVEAQNNRRSRQRICYFSCDNESGSASRS